MSQEPIARILARYKDRNDLAAMARRLHVSYSSLARILNENDPYDLGVRKLVDFIEAAGRDFTLLDHIEARLGWAKGNPYSPGGVAQDPRPLYV